MQYRDCCADQGKADSPGFFWVKNLFLSNFLPVYLVHKQFPPYHCGFMQVKATYIASFYKLVSGIPAMTYRQRYARPLGV